jgi:hypothetical protein
VVSSVVSTDSTAATASAALDGGSALELGVAASGRDGRFDDDLGVRSGLGNRSCVRGWSCVRGRSGLGDRSCLDGRLVALEQVPLPVGERLVGADGLLVTLGLQARAGDETVGNGVNRPTARIASSLPGIG